MQNFFEKKKKIKNAEIEMKEVMAE